MMKKAGFIILFVAILFGLSKPPTFADNEKEKHKETQIVLPVEVPVTITVPSVVPTTIPLPTITETTPSPTPIKVTPTPTDVPTPTPTTTPGETTTPIVGNAGNNDTTPKNEAKQTETPANPTTKTSIQTAATAVTKNTVKKTVSKTPQNKPTPSTTNVGNIIVPTVSSDVKVKGANYYIDEKLSKDTTMALISFSFFLFIMGIGILNVPNFIRSIADIRRKNAARKSEHPFTIRYLDF